MASSLGCLLRQRLTRLCIAAHVHGIAAVCGLHRAGIAETYHRQFRGLLEQEMAGCCSLLRRLLVANPAERATMKEIFSHPWFLVELPVKALYFNEELEEHPSFYHEVRCAGVSNVPELVVI